MDNDSNIVVYGGGMLSGKHIIKDVISIHFSHNERLELDKFWIDEANLIDAIDFKENISCRGSFIIEEGNSSNVFNDFLKQCQQQETARFNDFVEKYNSVAVQLGFNAQEFKEALERLRSIFNFKDVSEELYLKTTLPKLAQATAIKGLEFLRHDTPHKERKGGKKNKRNWRY